MVKDKKPVGATHLPVLCRKCKGSGRIKSNRDGTVSACRRCFGQGFTMKKLKGKW